MAPAVSGPGSPPPAPKGAEASDDDDKVLLDSAQLFGFLEPQSPTRKGAAAAAAADDAFATPAPAPAAFTPVGHGSAGALDDCGAAAAAAAECEEDERSVLDDGDLLCLGEPVEEDCADSFGPGRGSRFISEGGGDIQSRRFGSLPNASFGGFGDRAATQPACGGGASEKPPPLADPFPRAPSFMELDPIAVGEWADSMIVVGE